MSSADPRLNRLTRAHLTPDSRQSPPAVLGPSPQPPKTAITIDAVQNELRAVLEASVDAGLSRRKLTQLEKEQELAREELRDRQKKHTAFPIIIEQAESTLKRVDGARESAAKVTHDRSGVESLSIQAFFYTFEGYVKGVVDKSHDDSKYVLAAQALVDPFNQRLHDLEQRLKSNEEENKLLREQNNHQSASLKALESAVKALQSVPPPDPLATPDILRKVGDLEKRLSEKVENYKKGFTLKIANLEDSRKTSDGIVSQFQDEIRRLPTTHDLEEKFKKLTGTESGVRGIETRVQKLETLASNDHSSQQLQNLDNLKSEVLRKMDFSLQTQANIVQRDVSGLAARQKELENQVREANSSATTRENILSTFQSIVAGHGTRLAAVEGQLNSSDQSRATAQQSQLDTLNQKVDTLKSGIPDMVKSWWKDHSQRITDRERHEALQSRVTSLENSELSKEVQTMQQNILRLEHLVKQAGDPHISMSAQEALSGVRNLQTQVSRIERSMQEGSTGRMPFHNDESLQKRLDDLSTTMARHDNDVVELDRTVQALLRAGLSSDDRKALESIKRVDKRIDKMEHQQQHLITRFDNLSTEGMVKRMVGFLNPLLPKFEQGLRNLEVMTSRIDTLKATIKVMTEVQDNLKRELNDLSEQNRTIRSRLDHYQARTSHGERAQNELDHNQELKRIAQVLDLHMVASVNAQEKLAKDFHTCRHEMVEDVRILKEGRLGQEVRITALEEKSRPSSGSDANETSGSTKSKESTPQLSSQQATPKPSNNRRSTSLHTTTRSVTRPEETDINHIEDLGPDELSQDIGSALYGGDKGHTRHDNVNGTGPGVDTGHGKSFMHRGAKRKAGETGPQESPGPISKQRRK